MLKEPLLPHDGRARLPDLTQTDERSAATHRSRCRHHGNWEVGQACPWRAKLPDGDDYIVLAAEAETGLRAALRTATAATAELANQQISVDITMLTDDNQRAALLNRLLKHASIDARHEVTRRREVPIARLTPHYKPASDGSVAFSGIRLP